MKPAHSVVLHCHEKKVIVSNGCWQSTAKFSYFTLSLELLN